MKMSMVTLSLLSGGALWACSAPPVVVTDTAQGEVDRQILEASRRIQSVQMNLYQAGALDHAVQKVPVAISGDEQPVSLVWNGDAFGLLTKLAADRGLGFSSMGVRMPLPVAINAKREPFGAVLDAIRAQTGYRAVIVQSGGKLTLQYNRPQP